VLAIAGVGFCIFLTTKKRRRPTPNPSLQREGRSKPCANNKVLRRVVIPDEQERRVIAVGGSSFLTTKKGIQIANREENLSAAGMPPLLQQLLVVRNADAPTTPKGARQGKPTSPERADSQ